MGVQVVSHPLASSMLADLRDQNTPPPLFRLLAKRLALVLCLEATKSMLMMAVEVETPLARAPGARLAQPLVAVPVLRAGLGMLDAVTELFRANDRTRIVSMLPETFVLKVPETLPYGGSYRGPAEFDRFFQLIYDDHDYWSSFHTELELDRVLDAGTHLVAPIRVTARAKSSEATINAENRWLFEIADGNFVRAQNYADTAAARNIFG